MSRRVEWRDSEKGLRAWVIDEELQEEREATWAAQPGSQEYFDTCPVFECLYEGTRGPGKTDSLLMDFAREIGNGWGAEWRGILFRRRFPDLADVIAKSQKWFPLMWPEARYKQSPRPMWEWPGGETLIFSAMHDPEDYWKYHGHAYPWMGWEELVTWPTDECYMVMFACSRSTVVGMPRKIRSTCNPYGAGHNWVKRRWELPALPGSIVGPLITDPVTGLQRVSVHGDIHENRVMLRAEPDYALKIVAAAGSNESKKAAWLQGSWDVTSGGIVDDVFHPRRAAIVVPSTPLTEIPRGWRLYRAYDHGTSKPFSVGWWAESNGEPWALPGGRLVGHRARDLVRVAEWYGCKKDEDNTGLRMTSRAIADGIKSREMEMGVAGRVAAGPADVNIFKGSDIDPKATVAGEMEAAGVRWTPAAQGPGSRKQGAEALRTRLEATTDEPRERPALFVMDRCTAWLRTVPALSRSEADPDDADSDGEDHAYDETRYMITAERHALAVSSWK